MSDWTIRYNDGTEETYSTKKEMLINVGEHILSHAEQSMTLRQLYYRLVAKDIIENKQSEYQYLGQAMKEGRIDGKIPWDAIEDRTRSVDAGDSDYISPHKWFLREKRRFTTAAQRYSTPRWLHQEHYVEVWVEKEALANVFKTVCEDLAVVSFPNRGYTSITMLHEAAERIQEESEQLPVDTTPVILYFGDYDPSGQDIERNIRDKLTDTFDIDVRVERVALTEDQIHKHELPPQPAKTTDSRYEQFVEEHGEMAFELDALPPARLRELIRENVNRFFDEDTFEEQKREVEAQAKREIDGKLTSFAEDESEIPSPFEAEPKGGY